MRKWQNNNPEIGLTVGELIEKLKKFPMDKKVVFRDSEEYYADYWGITDVSLEHVKHWEKNIYRRDRTEKSHCVVLDF